MTIRDFIMNGSIHPQIENLSKDKKRLFLKVLLEEEEINEDLKSITSTKDIEKLFDKIIKKIEENRDDIKKIFKNYKKDLSILKDKQDLLILEEKILENIKQ